MVFETREELLQKYINADKPVCPHCSQEMTLWEVPPITFGDGLGWGTPYLYVCFNDDCPSFTQGWDHLQETVEYEASYRCIQEPGKDNFEYMPVFSPDGGKSQKLDDAALAAREREKEAMKQGFSFLTDCYINKDWDEILKILLDPAYPAKVRLKSAEMVGELGGVEAIEPLTNHKFPTPVLQEAVDTTVRQLHERHYTRECPFCAEIIKRRASVCKHCQKEVPKA